MLVAESGQFRTELHEARQVFKRGDGVSFARIHHTELLLSFSQYLTELLQKLLERSLKDFGVFIFLVGKGGFTRFAPLWRPTALTTCQLKLFLEGVEFLTQVVLEGFRLLDTFAVLHEHSYESA